MATCLAVSIGQWGASHRRINLVVARLMQNSSVDLPEVLLVYSDKIRTG